MANTYGLSYDNRVKFESENIYVGRNHEWPDAAGTAVYLRAGFNYDTGVTVNTQTARQIASALYEAADEFDTARAKYLKDQEAQLPEEDGLYVSGGYAGSLLGYTIFQLWHGEWKYNKNGEPVNLDHLRSLVQNYGPLKKLGVVE